MSGEGLSGFFSAWGFGLDQKLWQGVLRLSGIHESSTEGSTWCPAALGILGGWGDLVSCILKTYKYHNPK